MHVEGLIVCNQGVVDISSNLFELKMEGGGGGGGGGGVHT